MRRLDTGDPENVDNAGATPGSTLITGGRLGVRGWLRSGFAWRSSDDAVGVVVDAVVVDPR